MKKWKILSLLGFGLLLIFCSSDKAQLIHFPSQVNAKADKALSKEELGAKDPSQIFFSQSWNFFYLLDDSSCGYIQFSQSRILYSTNNLIVHHTYYSPEGKVFYKKEYLPVSEMKWEIAEPRLSMGRHYWTGFYPEFRVFVPLEGMETSLTLDCLTPGFRPWDGPIHYGSPKGSWYELVIPIPWARLNGTIKIDKIEKKVSGFAFQDHNIQTILFPQQCETLNSLKSFSSNRAIHFVNCLSPKDFGHKPVQWIMIIKDGQIICASDDFQIEPISWAENSSKNIKYPAQIKILSQNPELSLEGETVEAELLEIIDTSKQIPKWAKLFTNLLGAKPVFVRQKAKVNWKLNFQGQEENFSTQGIFEYSFLAEK